MLGDHIFAKFHVAIVVVVRIQVRKILTVPCEVHVRVVCVQINIKAIQNINNLMIRFVLQRGKEWMAEQRLVTLPKGFRV